jgi:hypothetical protein
LRLRSSVILVLSLLSALGAFLVFGCEEDQTTTPTQRYAENGGGSYSVGDSVTVRIDDFVGGLTINAGGKDSVRVNFTKWAGRESDLARISLSMTQVSNEIEIVGANPAHLNDASVDIEVDAPPGSELILRVGVGNIKSFIRPAGNCRFEVGPGNILLELPGDMGATVYLSTGVGMVSVEFPVDGSVTKTMVDGTIGAGDEAEIWAHTAVGSILVARQEPFKQSRESPD